MIWNTVNYKNNQYNLNNSFTPEQTVLTPRTWSTTIKIIIFDEHSTLQTKNTCTMQKQSGQLPVVTYTEWKCEKQVLPASLYCFSVSAKKQNETQVQP